MNLQSVHILYLGHANLTLVTPSLVETNPWMTAGQIRIIDRKSMFVVDIVSYLCDLWIWKSHPSKLCPRLRPSIDVKRSVDLRAEFGLISSGGWIKNSFAAVEADG